MNAMDCKLWSNLPEDILLLVLQHLPISSLCKFRVVSKHWNTLPTVLPEHPYLLDIPRDQSLSGLQQCSLYNPMTQKWGVLDLSFLPSHMAELCSRSPLSFHIERLCSDGGLLCWQARFVRTCGPVSHPFVQNPLFVCNPLTRCCKLLPSFSVRQVCVDLVMHRERSSGQYKIFAVTIAHSNRFPLSDRLLRLFMYDSVSDRWELILSTNRECSAEYLFRCCSAIFEGKYYLVLGGGRQAYEIHAYDIEQESWVAAGVKMKLDQKTLQVLFVVIKSRLVLIASILEKASWFFKISRVDLSRMDDLVESVVVLPVSIPWHFAATALAYRDSILLASSFTVESVLVDSCPDLEEVKAFTLIPASSESYKHGICTARISFDVQATV